MQHYRFSVEPDDWPGLPKSGCAVVSARSHGVMDGTLVVLTGTANDILDVSGYKLVINVTWSHDYTSNPTWLKRVLVEVYSACGSYDVLALSRGVQGLLAAYDSEHGDPVFFPLR